MSNSLDAFPSRRLLRISTDIPLFARCSSNSSSSRNNQNVTPGTALSTGIPQCFFRALCMHEFESSDPDHLSFHKDEVLTIVKQEHSGWWAAMRPQGDRIGWVPSSFVLPLDGSRISEHPDKTLAPWQYGSLSDHPLSAVHDPWVPVSEDCTALLFQLVTPTDSAVLHKATSDNKARDREPFFSLPNNERLFHTEDVCVPPTLESPPTYRIRRSRPPIPLPLEPGASRTWPASSPLLDAAHDETPHLRLATPITLDDIVSELVSSLNIQDSLLGSVASQDDIYPDDGIYSHSQRLKLSIGFRSGCAGQGISNLKLFDLATLGPDDLAVQLCVLVHTLYTTIHLSDCLDWVARRKSTGMTGLRHFFDTHDYIASWVQESILANDDVKRQTETLDFWIRVAERCHALRNFDSLCAVILTLSGSSLSSLGSAWARCTRRQTFVVLYDMLDVDNEFHCFMDIMDAAEGPSIPFVRRCLERIEELHSKIYPRRPGGAADAGSSAALHRMQLGAASTMLRYQSSPYDFEITDSVRGFIDDRLAKSLARSWDIPQCWEQPR